MDRGALPEDGVQRRRIHAGDSGGIEVAEPAFQIGRTAERLLDGDLLVEREAWQAESLRDLYFIFANDTHRVVAYRQAMVWEAREGLSPHVVQASHVSELEPNAPHVRWLNELSAWLRRAGLREDVARVTQLLAHELEFLIRVAPEQWHLFQPNWPSDPGY